MQSYLEITQFLLNTSNVTPLINDTYFDLAQSLVEIDEYEEFRADWNVIDECLHTRYPHGLPCERNVTELIQRSIYEEKEDREQNEEAIKNFHNYSSTIKVFILNLDQEFATLQANYFEEFIDTYIHSPNQQQARLHYLQFRQAVDYRFPKQLTVSRRNEVEYLISRSLVARHRQ